MSGDCPVIDASLVRCLIDSQFPKWKNLPITPVAESGWDNRTFHLGDKMAVRMPSAADYELQVEKEHEWLPKLAPSLPVLIPEPLAVGTPEYGYPWKWSVYRWLDGESVAMSPVKDLVSFAGELASFLKDLQQIDTEGGPQPGIHSFFRGGSLSNYDSDVRKSVHILKGKLDSKAALDTWDRALATSWKNSPVWVHGDISAGNLLHKDGSLSAVIDFGQLAIGDPACDLAINWTLFREESRSVFQTEGPLSFDEGTWERARGWALWRSVVVAAGLSNPNNFESKRCWTIIEEVMQK